MRLDQAQFPQNPQSTNIAGLTTRGEVGEWLKPAVC
jgi:hypothetical protein